MRPERKQPVIERNERPGKRRIIDFDIAIGHRIRVQRSLRNVTQTQLANAIGITFQQIQKYEHGTNRISAGKLLQVAHFLGIPVALFFEGLESADGRARERAAGPEYHHLKSFVASPEGGRLCRAFAQIGKRETQLNLLRMVESLATVDEAT